MPIVFLRCLWLALLLVPNVTTLAFANAWEVDRPALAITSLAVVAALYAWLPRRVFLVVTYPLVLAGLIVVGADGLRSVNVLDFLAVAPTFGAGEVANAMRPYVGAIALAAGALLALLLVLWRRDAAPPAPLRWRAGLAAAGILAASALPAAAWLATWPLALLPALAGSQSLDVGIQLSNLPDMRASPRDPRRSWNAVRAQEPAQPETYVLVIGETIRADRLPGCGGRARITPAPADALRYCDVLAGSSHSVTSVPLLVSRALPGHAERVPRDATFLKAFEEVGFDTFWLAVQERSIAWPDARHQFFEAGSGLDTALLLPRLDDALARPARRKMIVLHAYNAHSPYPQRYRPETAPFAADARQVETDAQQRWNAYDNAVDESMRFLARVVDRLRAQPGAVFLLYTPDHGENMADDPRKLLEHALKFPTWWDTRVPAIAWANNAWRQDNAAKWQSLAANQSRPLMHMDVVPTLLGAAGIAYEERRRLPVDLTARLAPERARFTHARKGVAVSMEQLEVEAGLRRAAPLPDNDPGKRPPAPNASEGRAGPS